MAKIPFHRKVLPWMFTIIFIIIAPALVFYTSGYRWNPKKHAIERNGTLIIDTLPTGASIKLNGQNIPETTSVTLQNMAPGNYNIELNLNGYHPWSKTLWVEPERVTFASEIILWPDVSPQLMSETNVEHIFSDSDAGLSLVVSNEADGSTSFGEVDKNGQIIKRVTTKENITISDVNWNPYDNKRVLVQGNVSSTSGNWLVQTSPPLVSKIPDGIFHWESNGLVGYTPDDQFSIRSDQSVERQEKPANLKDAYGGWKIQELPQATGLILVQGDNAKQGLVLPPGQWRLWYQKNGSVILREQNHWLWMDTNQAQSVSRQATGDWLLPIIYKKQIQFVYKNNNEAWVWLAGQEPQLIYRQSDPLVNVSWHAEGRDVMVATKQEVLMFSLDDRNGRNKTVLATFDEIKDAAIIDNFVYIAGRKDNKSGFWRLPLSLKTSTFSPLGKLGF